MNIPNDQDSHLKAIPGGIVIITFDPITDIIHTHLCPNVIANTIVNGNRTLIMNIVVYYYLNRQNVSVYRNKSIITLDAQQTCKNVVEDLSKRLKLDGDCSNISECNIFGSNVLRIISTTHEASTPEASTPEASTQEDTSSITRILTNDLILEALDMYSMSIYDTIMVRNIEVGIASLGIFNDTKLSTRMLEYMDYVVETSVNGWNDHIVSVEKNIQMQQLQNEWAKRMNSQNVFIQSLRERLNKTLT
jgi:hypothetical protein